jgi:hypothetical protein
LKPEPKTDVGPQIAPMLVPASTLKQAPDLSDQKTPLARPDHLGADPSGERELSALDPMRVKLGPGEVTRRERLPLGAPPAVHAEALERQRLRRLRTRSLSAQAAHTWGQLKLRTRLMLTLGCLLAGGGAAFALVRLLVPEPEPRLPAEPTRLSMSPEQGPYFYGLGDGVDFSRAEAKEFGFDFVAPTEAAVLLHYQAREIDRDEVAILLNGVEVGFVPPDIGVPDREIETLLPPRLLKKSENNVLVFDNVRNPPGLQPWRVGRIWLELLPIPPASPAEALRRARELARQAGQLYEQRAVGTDNVFRSWKAYRLAWQVLLAVPEDQRTTLFEQTRRKASDLAQELDRQCGALLLEAKKQLELKNPERAKELLDSVGLFFPDTEHHCHQLATEKLGEYQL